MSEPKKESRRRFLKYGAGVVAVGVVAAAGYGVYQMSQPGPAPPTPSTTSAASTASSATTTVAPPTTAVGKPWEGQSIHAAMTNVPGTDQILSYVPSFQNQYNIQLSHEYFSSDAVREKTLIDFEGHTKQYDVVMTGTDFTPLFTSGNMIVPLDQYINDPSIAEPDQLALDDIVDAFRGMGQFNGVEYELPHYGESTFTFWRTDLYEKYGLSEPKTTDDLWHNAETIFKGEKGKVFGITLRGRRGQGENCYTYAPVMRAFGARFFKDYPKDLTPTLDSSENLAALKWYSGILQNFAQPGVAGMGVMDCLVDDQKGIVAQGMEATPIIHYIYKNKDSAFPDAWKAMPAMPCAPGYSVDKEKPMELYCWNWAINADVDDKRKMAAFKWMQFATGQKTTSNLWKGVDLPTPFLYRGAVTRKSVLALPQIQAEKDVWVDAFLYSAMNADVEIRPRIPEWPDIGDIVGLYLQDTIAGGAKPEYAVARMQDEVERIVKAAKYPPYA